MIHIWTDGSAVPGMKSSGGAYFIDFGGNGRFDSGYIHRGDSNNAELMAVIHALEQLDPGQIVTIHTDSLFVIGINNRSVRRWNTPPALHFAELCKEHKIEFIQVLRESRPIQHHIVHHLAREAARMFLKVI